MNFLLIILILQIIRMDITCDLDFEEKDCAIRVTIQSPE